MFEDMIELKTISEREHNQILIKHDLPSQKILQKLKEIELFLDDFGCLSVDRPFIICRNNHILSLQMVLLSLEFTAGSIISCCEFGCLADANTLLRKYRDDIFFYLYIIAYDRNKFEESVADKIVEMEKNIESWINNNLIDLHIGDVLKTIALFPEMHSVIKKYKLKSFFDRVGNRLNNYVHSNGVAYYNRSVIGYKSGELQGEMKMILDDMNFITVSFLFLLTLCSPITIMSTDYVDCLDLSIKPPEGSQYWVAPFIVDFFKKNLDLIDKSCIDYLRENTPMEF